MSTKMDILNAVEAEVRSTIESMLDDPYDYFSLEGMEDEAAMMDIDEVRRHVARKLSHGPEMV